ncbi:MAG: leucine-rich repeat domain-containing protein [Oscillospiraceae bacterium]
MHGDIGDWDLSLLERCTNLKVLVLDYQQIRDISSLEGLPLEYLSLAGNQVTDIRALSGMHFPSGTGPGGKSGKRHSGAGSSAHAQGAVSGGHRTTFLEVLSGSALEELNVHSTWVTDYGVLADCGSLRSLVAGELPSGAWESIAGLVTLEELRVYSSSRLDLSLLEGMENLRDLDLYGSSISKPEALALLPRLRNLNLGETGLMDLSFMPDMPALCIPGPAGKPHRGFRPSP